MVRDMNNSVFNKYFVIQVTYAFTRSLLLDDVEAIQKIRNQTNDDVNKCNVVDVNAVDDRPLIDVLRSWSDQVKMEFGSVCSCSVTESELNRSCDEYYVKHIRRIITDDTFRDYGPKLEQDLFYNNLPETEKEHYMDDEPGEMSRNNLSLVYTVELYYTVDFIRFNNDISDYLEVEDYLRLLKDNFESEVQSSYYTDGGKRFLDRHGGKVFIKDIKKYEV